jgi:hypothetical protein
MGGHNARMELTLTTWERLICFNAVSGLQGLDAGGMRKAAKLLDIFDFTKEEREAITYVVGLGGSVTWDASKEPEGWPIAIGDGNLGEFLKSAIQKPDVAPTYKARELVKLYDKLGIKEPEKS